MLLTLLRQHTRSYAGQILAALALQLVAALTTLWLPSLNARIIDHGVAQGDTGYIWRTGGVMLLVALLQGLSAVAAVWFGARISMGVGRDLRARVYRRVDSFGAQDVALFGAPTLITRGTNDVQQVQMVVLMGLNMLVNSPLMVIGGIIMAVREDAGLSWLVWITAPLLMVIMGLLMRQLVPLFTSMQVRVDGVNSVIREQILGIRVVRAFVRERFETEKFDDANHRITDVSLRVGRIFVLMGPMMTLLMHGATVAILWFGGHRVDSGSVDVGSLTAFMQYVMQILTAVMMGSFVAMMLPRAIICARRIGEVLDTEPSVSEPAVPVRLEDPRGVVRFENVTFSFPGADAPVLHDVSFTAEPGRTTAVIGSTGAGKSTLLGLVPRLYDAAEGRVLVDGVDVRDLGRQDLARLMGLVPQKPYLFSGTVAENLRFGNEEATDDDLWSALETAQAADFVRARETGAEEPEAPAGPPPGGAPGTVPGGGPENAPQATGLASTVSQGGTNVSGGQRQRLSIARALAAEPKIYLFDDAFSALDVATDARLRAALAPKTAEATVILVAQRVSTIRSADQILVLDAGRIVGRGTHEELLESSPTYREIVESQLAAEETA